MIKVNYMAAPVFLLCMLFVLSAVPAAYAQENDPILAERVEAEDLESGDRIILVSNAAGKAVSTQPAGKNGTFLAPSDIMRGNTRTREVLPGSQRTPLCLRSFSGKTGSF